MHPGGGALRRRIRIVVEMDRHQHRGPSLASESGPRGQRDGLIRLSCQGDRAAERAQHRRGAQRDREGHVLLCGAVRAEHPGAARAAAAGAAVAWIKGRR